MLLTVQGQTWLWIVYQEVWSSVILWYAVHYLSNLDQISVLLWPVDRQIYLVSIVITYCNTLCLYYCLSVVLGVWQISTNFPLVDMYFLYRHNLKFSLATDRCKYCKLLSHNYYNWTPKRRQSIHLMSVIIQKISKVGCLHVFCIQVYQNWLFIPFTIIQLREINNIRKDICKGHSCNM